MDYLSEDRAARVEKPTVAALRKMGTAEERCAAISPVPRNRSTSDFRYAMVQITMRSRRSYYKQGTIEPAAYNGPEEAR